MAFDNSCTKAVLISLAWATPKGVTDYHFSFAALGQAPRGLKALDLRSLNMQFQQDWPKDEKITVLLNFCQKT